MDVSPPCIYLQYLPYSFNDYLVEYGVEELLLTSGTRTWRANCKRGTLEGPDWLEFLKAHSLEDGKIIVFNFDMDGRYLHVLIFGSNNVEQIYPWY